MLSNYPPGVSEAHPYFNPPDEEPCRECGEDVYPGEVCEECGCYALTVDELREDWAAEQADHYNDERKYDHD